VVRSGDLVEQVCRVVTEADADEVHMAAGHSGFALRREGRPRAALETIGRPLVVHDAGTGAVPPGTVTPPPPDPLPAFTPCHRQWAQVPLRAIADTPRRVRVPDGVDGEDPDHGARDGVSPALPAGGERAARDQTAAYWRDGLDDYDTARDDLA